jgi:hypothetical protein
LARCAAGIRNRWEDDLEGQATAARQLIDARDQRAAHAVDNAVRGVNATESTIRQTAAMIRSKLDEIGRRLDHGLNLNDQSRSTWEAEPVWLSSPDWGRAGQPARDSLTRGPCQVPTADACDGRRGNQPWSVITTPVSA